MPKNILHTTVQRTGDWREVAEAIDEIPENERIDTLNEQDETGMTPLMYAAQGLKGDIAKHLRDAGADPSIKTPNGETAVDIFDEAYNADREAIEPNILDKVRAYFQGGRRRRKTRARLSRKTKRRQTRRRR